MLEMAHDELCGRISGTEIKRIAWSLASDSSRVVEWMERMFRAENPHEIMNRAWVLSHVGKEIVRECLSPYYDAICRFAMEDLPVRRGLILGLLLKLEPPGEPNIRFLDFCLSHLVLPSEKDSCRAAMIYLAEKICKPYPELSRELRLTIDLLPPGIAPSIACARRKVLGRIASSSSIRLDNRAWDEQTEP